MIIYSVVTNGRTVLAEYTGAQLEDAEIPVATRALLAKIGPDNRKMSYSMHGYAFHYIVSDGTTFLCMTNPEDKWRLPFAFLDDIHERFNQHYAMSRGARSSTATLFEKQSDFGPVLKARMAHFNEHGAGDTIGKLKEQIADVKEVVLEQVDKVLERGEQLDLLIDKTHELNSTAYAFERQSTRLKRAMLWRKCQKYLCVATILALLGYLLAAWACGGLGVPKCRSTAAANATAVTPSPAPAPSRRLVFA